MIQTIRKNIKSGGLREKAAFNHAFFCGPLTIYVLLSATAITFFVAVWYSDNILQRLNAKWFVDILQRNIK
jgi:hypothetical protein